MCDSNVISVFDSALTRTLNMKIGELYTDIIVVQTYYYDIVKDIVINGFTLNGEKYRCLTASAGQIRTKKTVFIKESIWSQYEKTFMCGLTLDKINAKGGVNVNKYLAYLALQNSATDPWPRFDIDKAIVINDFETAVHGLVDYIDYNDYSIERKEMDISIEHTDGCGMILPYLSHKNFMVRLPWIKGLLASFPFDKFIREHNASPIIKDIYGVEHNIFEEKIQVIFTKSQFKMHSYYDSWQEYKDCYKKYNCSAGKCNVEENYFDDAKFNYQMLQTLSDLTDEEIETICNRTTQNINNVCKDRETMLKVFKATKTNQHRTAEQDNLLRYPPLLQDPYYRQTLSDYKKSMVKEAWSAKLDINGKYTFLIPDLYAACEYWFLGNKNPQGLLKDGEVSCALYPEVKKVDCLRSPHLAAEHAVRKNVINENTKQWFLTKGIYTSCFDLISKILMFDVDGDRSLVCADQTIVKAAERNMKDIVPLYYDMKKAAPMIVNNEVVFDGLNAAYKGGRIGEISNLITKIWNSEDIKYDIIKLLVMENNFTIDYAKTLFKPTRPSEIHSLIQSYNRQKTPYFFQYAKDKTPSQISPKNNSCVNRIQDIVGNPKFDFQTKQLGKLNYKMLLYDKRIDTKSERAQNVIDDFKALLKQYNLKLNDTGDEHDNYAYIAKKIKDELFRKYYDDRYVCDVLTKHYFYDKHTVRKKMFLICFSDIINENLCKNLDDNIVFCQDCGEQIELSLYNRKTTRCEKCYEEYRKKYERDKKRRQRSNLSPNQKPL